MFKALYHSRWFVGNAYLISKVKFAHDTTRTRAGGAYEAHYAFTCRPFTWHRSLWSLSVRSVASTLRSGASCR